MHDSSPSTAPPPEDLLVILSLFHFWCVQATHLTVSVLFAFSNGFHRRFGSTKVITIGSIRQLSSSQPLGNIFQHEFHWANDVCWVNQSIISYLKTAKRFSSTPKTQPITITKKNALAVITSNSNMHIERFQSTWPSWMTIGCCLSPTLQSVTGLTCVRSRCRCASVLGVNSKIVPRWQKPSPAITNFHGWDPHDVQHASFFWIFCGPQDLENHQNLKL